MLPGACDHLRDLLLPTLISTCHVRSDDIAAAAR